MTPLEIAKENLLIPALWKLRSWRGSPGKSCRVPWREDQSPSGSILNGGKLFHDFTSGETLDGPGLLARAEEMSLAAACRLFIQLAGESKKSRIFPNISFPKKKTGSKENSSPEIPALQNPTKADLCQLSEQRSISVEACVSANEHKHLFIAIWREQRCWVITDNKRCSAQIRRLDGNPFEMRSGAKVKALTIKGSRASWPIGIADATSAKQIILCEGGGDFLAAYHFAIIEGTICEVQPVAMLGAAQQIDESAFRFFKDKCVRIFPHLDAAGAMAALRWESQLRNGEIHTHCYDLAGLSRDDGMPVKDLNDLTRIAADDFEQNEELRTLTIF